MKLKKCLVAAFCALIMGPLVGTATASAAPTPALDSSGHLIAPARTQISYEDPITGRHVGTANEKEPRPGLSIVKLYIADYVFSHGTTSDKSQATEMLRYSNDAIASTLYAKYPTSINATARAYGLVSTTGAAHWGNSKTSSFDTVKFLVAKKRTNPSDPVLLAMMSASPVAADGYQQNYGTATLPGVMGSKWGWSDDRTSLHGSASIGSDFVVAANTYGTREQHTQDVQDAFATPLPLIPSDPTKLPLPLPEGIPAPSVVLPELPTELEDILPAEKNPFAVRDLLENLK